MLYPDELQAHTLNDTLQTIDPIVRVVNCGLTPLVTRRLRLVARIGRGRGIRTPDPLLPKQVRYQTAPCPGVACRIDGGPMIRTPLGSVKGAEFAGKILVQSNHLTQILPFC